ncbi:MAG TPA: hypothetical protein VLZ54_04125 [Arenibacter sp.]|nr:hypothetical protein [Arenibacter sp.]
MIVVVPPLLPAQGRWILPLQEEKDGRPCPYAASMQSAGAPLPSPMGKDF